MRYSKTTTSVLVLVCGAICGWTSAALAGPPDDQIIISEAVDATLPGGLPKYVELTNCGSPTVELSLYSLGNFNNGSTTYIREQDRTQSEEEDKGISVHIDSVD